MKTRHSLNTIWSDTNTVAKEFFSLGLFSLPFFWCQTIVIFPPDHFNSHFPDFCSWILYFSYSPCITKSPQFSFTHWKCCMSSFPDNLFMFLSQQHKAWLRLSKVCYQCQEPTGRWENIWNSPQHHLQAPSAPRYLRNSRCRTVSSVLYSAAKGSNLMSYGRAGSTFPPVLLLTAFPEQQRWNMGQSSFSPPALPPFQETPLFSFTNSAWQVFKIRLLMQDLVKESSSGLTGRTEEGWNIWQRREDLIPEEITNYTVIHRSKESWLKLSTDTERII